MRKSDEGSSRLLHSADWRAGFGDVGNLNRRERRERRKQSGQSTLPDASSRLDSDPAIEIGSRIIVETWVFAMSQIQTVSVGQSGDVPIPPSLRDEVGIDPGSVVTVEARNGTIVVRPIAGEVEDYTPQRKAEFLLSNAVDSAEYAAVCEEVRKMGLDPNENSSTDHAEPRR